MRTRLFPWLMTIHSPDPEVRRRGRNTIIVTLSLLALTLASLPGALAGPNPLQTLGVFAAGLVCFVGAAAAARAGRVDLAGMLMIGVCIIATTSSVGSTSELTAPFYLVIPIAIAGATLAPRAIGVALAAALAVLWAALLTVARAFLATESGLLAATGATALCIISALLAFLSARSTARALAEARAAAEAAREAQAALALANHQLEARVEERTGALAGALAAQRAQADQLSASLEAQRALNQTILELSLPIIPVSDDVLVAPLIGNLGSERAGRLMETALREVERRRAAALVLDVTGVPVVDTAVARALLEIGSAARLLGVQTVLVGIRPEVAQSIVALGVDFHSLQSASSLQEGLRLVGRRRDTEGAIRR